MSVPLPTRRHSSLAAWIGVATEDITPPVGIYARNWGAARHDVADAIHRPLTLTALVIAQGPQSEPLVLVDADLGWWKTPEVFRAVQTQLLERTGGTAARLIFGLSHTHAGPPLMEPEAALPGSQQIAPWIEHIVSATASAITRARHSACAAILDWHIGRCALAAYRDLPDPHAPGRFLCGYNPAVMADEPLLLGRVADAGGRVLATLVNYACHPTTLAWDNTAISPDFVGAMRDTLQRQTGAPALFLQGASGELAPRYQYVGDPRVADRHGRQLAYAALATLEDMEPPGHELAYQRTVESGAPLAVWSHQPFAVSKELDVRMLSVELPIKDWPSAAELESDRAACADRALEERLRRKRDIRRALGDGSTYRLPVWAWRLGDAALVGCCGEAYSCLQRELRRRLEGHALVCMNLINGSIGYLPPAPLYDEDLYQVWQTPFDRGSLERVFDALAAALAEWFPSQPALERSTTPAAAPPWPPVAATGLL